MMQFFWSNAGRITFVISLILALAYGGVWLSQLVCNSILRTDAEITAERWAKSLDDADDLTALNASVTPSPKTINLLREASEVGSIYRYKVWSKTGDLVFISDPRYKQGTATTLTARHGKRVADSILSGSTFTEKGRGVAPANPPYFAESYIPLVRKGVVIGAFEVYVDQTAVRARYKRSFLLTEGIVGMMMLLAGVVPGYMFYRRMHAFHAAGTEALFLAEHDSLTSIPNRRRLEETANVALAWSLKNKCEMALLLVDLDRFKEINDNYGHSTGDKLLQAFAHRLSSATRPEDLVACLGGDEFVILQAGAEQPGGAQHLAARVQDILRAPYDIDGLHLECGASVGVAIAPTDATMWDELLSCADAALYKAKAQGRNRISFFEAGMDAKIRGCRSLERDLRRAFDGRAFRLAYQPQFRLSDGRLLGFESLLRWPLGWEERSPAEFIPVAEDSGLIVPIGAWVLEAACVFAAEWTRPLKIAVNLSPVQFFQGNIVATVEHALRVSGLEPDRLELEVTESLWLQDTQAVMEQLVRLRALGVSIALDDFGTGYSSLTYLCKFPFDTLKVDRAFVSEINSDPKAGAIIKTVVALGRALNLTVTAEGVETQAQARALSEAGCDQVQGFWFGRPMTPASVEDLIEDDERNADLLAPPRVTAGVGG